MNNPPDTIYLQFYGDVLPDDVALPDGAEPGGVTWCADRVFNADVEYVRADRLKAMEAERDRLREAIQQHQRDVWGSGPIEHPDDRELYDAAKAAKETGNEC